MMDSRCGGHVSSSALTSTDDETLSIFLESQYEDLSFDTLTDDDDMTIIADGINYVAVDVGDLRDFDSESDITIVAEETTYNSIGVNNNNSDIANIADFEGLSVPSTNHHSRENNSNNAINSKVASEFESKVGK
ncbi:hypothetical protein EB796_020773 [Bugula neritina]|uniref:Uncharacterized protein n=1 Tax=Bugula neritina TaxID=10212 RepID=A0A7J7J453_BUGNE|nr:hypothetical protein EB796_020773 [Bugula neritina]